MILWAGAHHHRKSDRGGKLAKPNCKIPVFPCGQMPNPEWLETRHRQVLNEMMSKLMQASMGLASGTSGDEAAEGLVGRRSGSVGCGNLPLQIIHGHDNTGNDRKYHHE